MTTKSELDKKVDKDLSNVTGVLPISNGGTGATTQNEINYNLAKSMSLEDTSVQDGSQFVMSIVNPNSSVPNFYKRTGLKLWEYFKDKISSVLGLTASNYNGTSARASAVDELKHVRYFKNDNSGYVCYFLTHDITDFFDSSKYNTTTGSMTTRGFNGFVISYRENSGYNHINYAQGQLFYTATYRPVENALYLFYNNTSYMPYVVKNKTTNKYYLAIRCTGSGRNISFFGRWSNGNTSSGVSSYVGTEIKCTNSSGDLPTDYEIVNSFTNDKGTVLDLNPKWYDFDNVISNLPEYATKEELDEVKKNCEELLDENEELIATNTSLNNTISTLQTNLSAMTTDRDSWKSKYEGHSCNHSNCVSKSTYDSLQAKYDGQITTCNNLHVSKASYNALQRAFDEYKASHP